MFYWLLKIFLGPVVKFIWIKKIEGIENIPKKGKYIIAANHTSYLDFFSLAAVWPKRIYFLAGEVFFKKWWWRPLVKLTRQIKVDRQSPDKTEVYNSVNLLLRKGKIIGIFPEGTRSPDNKIGKAYPGVAKFALTNRVPVIPVGIKGAYEVFSRHQKLPKLKKNIEIKIGKLMLFNDYLGKENDRQVLEEITGKIMTKIAELAK